MFVRELGLNLSNSLLFLYKDNCYFDVQVLNNDIEMIHGTKSEVRAMDKVIL